MSRLQRLTKNVLRSLRVLVLLGIVFAMLSLLDVDLAPAARDLEAVAPLGTFWRLALVTGLVGLWGPLIRRLVRHRNLADERIEALVATRWSLAILLLGVELVLVQNLFGPLWSVFS